LSTSLVRERRLRRENEILRQERDINTNIIATNWDDILRVAGSLKVGTIHASTLVQALQHGGHPTTLGRAITELGRIPKTLHLLNYIDDEYYRRRIQTQLNRGEGRHGIARFDNPPPRPKRSSKFSRENHSSFGLFSSSDFRMVGDEVTSTAANPKLDVKVSLHPAFQCMVIGY
jgi:Tn3 transposase DDE domain